MIEHFFGFPGLTSGSNLSKLEFLVVTLTLSCLGLSMNIPVFKVLGLRPLTLTTGL